MCIDTLETGNVKVTYRRYSWMATYWKFFQCAFKLASLNSFERKHSLNCELNVLVGLILILTKEWIIGSSFWPGSILPKNTTQWQGQGSNPDPSIRAGECAICMGYWPNAKFFFGMFMDQAGSRSINSQKQRTRKDLLFGFWGNFSRGTRR